MTTAIIGTGNIGGRVATILAAGGEQVLLVNRDEAKARELATRLGDGARVAPLREAVQAADTVVLAVLFGQRPDVLAQVADLLPGKVVVDTANPITFESGSLVRLLPPGESAASVLVDLLPPGTALVKAFCSAPAEWLVAQAHRDPIAVLFYATDDDAAGERVAALITSAGFTPVRAGGIDVAARIEAGGDLFELRASAEMLPDVEQATRAVG